MAKIPIDRYFFIFKTPLPFSPISFYQQLYKESSMSNSESAFSKIIVGVSVPVLSTIILVYFGFKSGDDSKSNENGKSPQTETNFTPSTYEGEKTDYQQPTANIQTPPPAFKPLVFGKYMGSCYNETVMQEAQVILTIEHLASGKVVGTIHIYGLLAGTNKFEGFLDGNELSFTTREVATSVQITWEGIVEGNMIYGDYFVSMPEVYKMQGYTDQYGTWSVSK